MSDTIDGIPRLVPGRDVRTLPLSALDGFVLSRIDGRSGLAELVALTGLPEGQVAGIVGRLVELGAVEVARADTMVPRGLRGHGGTVRPVSEPPPAGGPRRRATASFPPVSSDGRERPSVRPSAPRSVPPPAVEASTLAQTEAPSVVAAAPVDEAPPAPSEAVGRTTADSVLAPPDNTPLYDVAELDEDVDLPRERRVQVLERYYRLHAIDHYALLGIADTADRKEIKSAYFALSKAFHPDTMFRKNLGTYKAKMVRVFEALTEAYDTLSKNKTRTEYDAYLAASRAAAKAERAMALPPLPESAAVARPKTPAPVEGAAARVTTPQPEATSPERAPARTTIAPPAAPRAPEPEPAPLRAATDDARRLAQEVVARRLRGVIRPAIPTPDAVDAAPGGASENPFDAPPKTDARQLLGRLTRTLKDVGQLTGGEDRVVRAVRLSQAALERGDLSEATQQLARAATLAPERQDLRLEHQRMSQKLAANMGDTWSAQAEFEMKAGKWAAAALSWAKVCEGKPDDPRAHRLAAQSLFKAGGDLRGAQKYAQKAVFLAPSDIDARISLAQIYLTAGLKLNARRELQTAAMLDPANEMVKNLLAELKG